MPLQNLPHRKLHELPRQDNHCDCGLFVLTYTEYFTHAMLRPQFSINVGELNKNGSECPAAGYPVVSEPACSVHGLGGVRVWAKGSQWWVCELCKASCQ
jgi:hypothetical protein